MRIGLIGKRKSSVINFLKEEFILLDHECKRLCINDFIFDIGTKEYISHRKHNILDIDLFVIVNYGINELDALNHIAQYLISINKKVVGYSKSVHDYASTLRDIFNNGIPVMRHIFTKGLKSARDALIEIDHPIILLSKSDKKYWSFSDDWTDSYDFVRANKSKDYEFKVLPTVTDKYYSCYFVENEHIVTLEKKVSDNNYNLSKKSRKKIVEINEIIEFAIKCHKISGFYFSRIDIGIDNGNFVLVDIFRFPQLKNLTRLNINLSKIVTETIIDSNKF